MIRRTKIITPLVLLALTLLAACNMIQPTPTVTPLPTATALPTDTPEPTLTPTPLPPLAVLLAPPTADPALVQAIEAMVYDPATKAGMRWQVLPSLAVEELTPELHLVVVLPPVEGVADLVAAAPQAQFLAIGIPDLPQAPNLTSLAASGARPDQMGFLAGYIAAMITPDYRIAMIGLADNVDSQAAFQGFVNGATYFCGMCNPQYPPFYDYPMYLELPAGAAPGEWQAVAQYLIGHMAGTVFVFPGAADDESLGMMAEVGIHFIGLEPPRADLQDYWVVSLRSTDALPVAESLLPALLKGESQGAVLLPLELTNANDNLFSPGRQRLAREVMNDLLAGFIDTGTTSEALATPTP